MYTIKCCDMIAVKREVAITLKGVIGFPWSECQEVRRPKNLTASHCTNRSLLRKTETRVLRMFLTECDENHNFLVRNQDTHGRVYSHRLSYLRI